MFLCQLKVQVLTVATSITLASSSVRFSISTSYQAFIGRFNNVRVKGYGIQNITFASQQEKRSGTEMFQGHRHFFSSFFKLSCLFLSLGKSHESFMFFVLCRNRKYQRVY